MEAEDAFTNRLSAYLDDDLGTVERAEVEAHLESCASCRTVLEELAAVRARARALPDSPPARDLWNGIAARLSPARSAVTREAPSARRISFTWPQLVAAGLALMILSGGAVWLATYGGVPAQFEPVAGEVRRPEPVAAGAAPPLADFAHHQYEEAIVELQRVLDEGRTRLDPQTVRILEENLRAIDAAIEDSRRALEADPSNTYLNAHLAAARKRKLALLRRATALATEG